MAATGSISASFTFPVLSGTATISYGETVTSTFTVSGEANYPEVVTDGFNVSDLYTSIITETVTSAVTVLSPEILPLSLTVPINEVVTVQDSFGSSEQTTLLSGGTFRTSDSTSSSTSLLSTSTLNVSNVITFNREIAVSSFVNLSDSQTLALTATTLVSDTAKFFDSVFPGHGITLSSTANVSDVVTHELVATETATSTVNASDVGTPTRIATNSLSDTFTMSETLSAAGSIYNNTLTATVNWIDTLIAQNLEAVAWVMNTESGGLTNYDNYDFSSMAFHDGVLYATSPLGVYELSGADDAGRDIGAVYKTGFADFKSENKKQISDIYVGYTADGTLECDVETYGAGQEVYTYEMQERTADAPRNSRIKVGRGLRSRHWRFTIRNVDGADFQINDLAINVATSKTRRL